MDTSLEANRHVETPGNRAGTGPADATKSVTPARDRDEAPRTHARRATNRDRVSVDPMRGTDRYSLAVPADDRL